MTRLAALKVDGAQAGASATPLMAQFFAAKAQQPGALIFFRMGDFYELFFDDARAAAPALGIALTQRGTHDGRPIPMAGVPIHAADAYLAKLIRAGFKVAVCEQLEAPEEARKRGAKAIVKRALVRVVTPGTLTEDALLDARGANRLAALAVRAGEGALACVELSTGEVETVEAAVEGFAAALAAWQPAEVLLTDRLFADPAMAETLARLGAAIEVLPAAIAEPAAAEARLKRLYAVETLDAFGPPRPAEMAALSLIAAHLEATQIGGRPPLQPPRRTAEADTLSVDPATRSSLEIERTLAGERSGTLIHAVDRTVTAAGARMLASRISRPLTSPAAIDARLDSVAWFFEREDHRRSLRGHLATVGDIARALSRLALRRGGPRDLANLRSGLDAGAKIRLQLATPSAEFDARPAELVRATQALTPIDGQGGLGGFLADLHAGLCAAPPPQTREGGFVAERYSSSLDEARGLRDGSRRVLAALEARLSAEAGATLKIKHNAVLGFFVEASARQAANLLQPPLNGVFIHRQTLPNQVRFTTADLMDLDAKISEAGELALRIEASIFEAWRDRAETLATEIQAVAEALAAIDVAAANAEWAAEARAVRPRIDRSLQFDATGGRHPVVEAALRRQGKAFTANDCRLDGDGRAGPRLSLVTGPNMAGKSTYLRQNALLCILAQAGCFVPAENLTLGVVDRLFSRVGAADDLARGRSTFMAEMIETAAILNQATARSFVILDEIGRGTATYDGLAIAWACVEALHDVNRGRTLFATHYHELAELGTRLAHVSNLSLRAKEWNGELVFLHEVGPGCADRSYGVHVARLAGAPAAMIARARQVLAQLERDRTSHAGLADLPLFAAAEPDAPTVPQSSELATALAALDLDGMSPREALEALYRLKALPAP